MLTVCSNAYLAGMKQQLLRRSLYEVIGTYLLIFFGCGSVTIDQYTGGALGVVGIGLCWGIAVLVAVYAFGETSGAHINPIVTLGFWASDRFPGREVLPYWGAQFLGSTLAILTWYVLYPDLGYGMTLPSGPVWQSLLLEVILTFSLMFVILKVATGSREIGTQAGISIGLYVGLAAMVGGPVSGASMNPARSFGPALVEGNFTDFWVYLVAPVAGSLLAVGLFRLLDRTKP